MAKLDWSQKGLTDSELSLKLGALSQDKAFTKAVFTHNKLEHVPNLTDFKQFECLEELDLSENNIIIMDTSKLPHQIKVLRVSDNKIQELGDLSRHHKLRELWLRVNRIKSVDPSHLPTTIRELDMGNNQLTEIRDFSQHHKLARLYVSCNQITGIDPAKLPANIKVLEMDGNRLSKVRDFSEHKKLDTLNLRGNEITEIYEVNTKISFWHMDRFGEKFFDNEDGYNHLVRNNFNSWYLEQPPEEVFLRGVKSVQSYFKDMAISKRVKHSRKRLVLLGSTEAGKTSMVESLIAGKAILVNIEDRTQVINLKQWKITEDDIIHIYDHGGHMIYSITQTLFISKHSIIFVVHDITKIQRSDIIQTTGVLRQALHQHPENQIYIIFTHTDLIQVDQQEVISNVLVGALKQFLDDEISNLNRLLIGKKLSDEKQDVIDATDNLLKHFKNKRSHLPFYCVSSQNYSGMEKVKKYLINVAKEKRTAIPESWVKFYKQIIGADKIYLTLDETSHFFKTSSKSHFPRRSTQTKQESDDVVPLQYFSDTNLLLHYESNPFLKGYVFPDLDSLVDLFKSLFHHNIAQVIQYDTEEKLQAKFKKEECDLAVQRYQKEGLLGQKLLSYLWERYGLSVDDKTVLLQLMQSFNLCYSISKDDDMHFFPWFVKSQACPSHINKDHRMMFDKKHSSVHLQCEFFNSIPLNIFEMISVCLQRKATQECHYMGDRQAWQDGLEISFGTVRCVLTRSEENSTIDICLYGKVDDMPHVWKVIESLLQDVQSILKPWHGVIRSIHIICGHCIILRISPPKHWLPELVFPQQDVLIPDFVQCPKRPSSEDIPAALVMACFRGNDSGERHSKLLKDLTKYLEKHWEVTDPPAAVVYLDCEQTDVDVFSLKWCLPQTADVPIINCVLEVNDGSGEWEPQGGPIHGISFTFQGEAVEFRVAAENKYGRGPYTCCTPTSDISDEKLLPCDSETLQHSKEMFSQMSSIKGITTRLSDREVLHPNAGNRVFQCLTERGEKEGAKKLVDEICRCTYRQLYLFRKTLTEFGQESLAGLVPIKSPEEYALQYEPYDVRTSQPPPTGENDYSVMPNINPSSGSSTLFSAVVSRVLPEASETAPEHHLPYLQSGVGQETMLDVSSVPHTSTTVSVHHHTEPVSERRLEKRQRLDETESRTHTDRQDTLLDVLTQNEKKYHPDPRFFGRIIPHVTCIHKLGSNLGFLHTEIQECVREVPNSVAGQVYCMLDKWEKKEGTKATVKKLLQALQYSGTPENTYRNGVLDYFRDSDSAVHFL